MLVCQRFYDIINTNWNLMERIDTGKLEIRRYKHSVQVIFKTVKLSVDPNRVMICSDNITSVRILENLFLSQAGCSYDVGGCCLKYPVRNISECLRSVLLHILPRIQFSSFVLRETWHKFEKDELLCISECIRATRPFRRPHMMHCVVNNCTPLHSQILIEIGSTETEIDFCYNDPFDEKVLTLRVETVKFKYEKLKSLTVIRKLIEEWVSGSRTIKIFKISKFRGLTPWTINVSEWREIVDKFCPLEVEKLTENDVRFKIGRSRDERILM